jgi:hypothetical protein
MDGITVLETNILYHSVAPWWFWVLSIGGILGGTISLICLLINVFDMDENIETVVIIIFALMAIIFVINIHQKYYWVPAGRNSYIIQVEDNVGLNEINKYYSHIQQKYPTIFYVEDLERSESNE